MRVPARIIATEKLVREMDEAVYQQISNVATLPGIAGYALCMPDGHSGYGFPIGGVAAMDVHEGGVISPGGIGFDINCGMRLITTNLTLEDVQPHLKEIVDRLFQRVPAGVGTHGFLKLSHNEFRDLVEQGARWCVERDLGWQEDLEFAGADGPEGRGLAPLEALLTAELFEPCDTFEEVRDVQDRVQAFGDHVQPPAE